MGETGKQLLWRSPLVSEPVFIFCEGSLLPEGEPDTCKTGARQPLHRGLHERQCIQESIVARL